MVIRANASLFEAGPVPEGLGNAERINAECLPPDFLIADTVHLAVVRSAQWHCELIARLAAKRAGLCIAKVMRIGWLAATDEARLPGDVSQVVLVAIAPRLGNREGALFGGPLIRGHLS